MNIRRFAALAVAGVMVSIGLAACSGGSGGSGDGGGDPQPGGELVMARQVDATTMLPVEMTANQDIWNSQLVYERLTQSNAEGTDVEPLLATKWSTSPDQLTWTFDLRDDVTFSNGSPMTSADVVFSLDFARTESDFNAWASSYSNITSTKAVGEHQVEITLAQPQPSLPQYLALFAAAIYPKDFGGHDEAYMRENVIGTGPFVLGEWNRGQSVTLEKNPDYWQSDVPYLDSVTFTVVPDDNTRSLQLKGQQIDVYEAPAPASLTALKNTPDVETTANTAAQVLYLAINTRKDGLADPQVRRALSYAVDRDAIIETTLSGYGEAAGSWLPKGMFGHVNPDGGAEFDLEKAEDLIADSEASDGLSLTMQVVSGNPQNAQIAQILKESFSKIGVELTIETADQATVSAARKAGTYDILIGSATSDVVDPVQLLDYLVLADGSGINTGYDNPEVLALSDELKASTDPSEQKDLLAQIQEQVTADSPLVPIAYQPLLYAYSSKVHGFSNQLLGNYTLATTWIEH